MNKADSPLVYSWAFWGFFCRFGHSLESLSFPSSYLLSVKIVGILFPIQSLIMRSNSQRLPVTQYRLHSKVIVSLVINYHTLSSDAANLAVLFVLLNES